MARSSGADDSFASLAGGVQSTTGLLSRLEADLHAIASSNPASASPPSSSSEAVDSISLAHDSASLIRAQSTKLSLLVITEPFTPSAILTVLRELVAGPVPALASAVQLSDPATFTAVARQDVAWRCYRVLHELRGLVGMVPLDGRALPTERKNGVGGGRGSLPATGIIWAACDEVMQLKQLGIAGLLVRKAEEYRDTLQDVLEELRGWSQEEEGEDEDDGAASEDGAGGVAHQLPSSPASAPQQAQEMLDDLMDSRRIPRNDPNKIRERLDSCLKRLRLTTLLYSATAKRRLRTLPPLPATTATAVTRRLDEVFPLLRKIPHRFNEVACAFYELEPRAIDQTMDACFLEAFAASEMLMKPWEGQRDGFTEWAEKFQAAIRKPAGAALHG